jgi:hypothetical protein
MAGYSPVFWKCGEHRHLIANALALLAHGNAALVLGTRSSIPDLAWRILLRGDRDQRQLVIAAALGQGVF